MYISLEVPGKLFDKVDILIDRILYLSESVSGLTYDSDKKVIELHLDSEIDGDRISSLRDSFQTLCIELENVRSIKERVVKTNLPQSKDHSRKPNGNTVNDSTMHESGILLKEKLDQTFLKIAKKNGAQMREYPSILTKDNMLKNQYHVHFPQNIFGVASVPHNIDAIKTFRLKAKEERYNDALEFKGEVLQPCICYHCYEELQGQILTKEKALTGRGECYRHEVKWREDKFRKSQFTMREIVFIGDEEHVINMRNDIMNVVWNLFESIGLKGRIATATDPFFFSQDLKTKGTYQMMSNAKYELIVTTSTGKEVSIASFNYCNDMLCSKYNIKDVNGQPLHSGCIAFGTDRWKEAIIDLYGYKTENWPDLNIEMELFL
ncbi:tRNA synthetase class II core domain (G, H, P, S and T) [Paenibacillus sp. OK060]|uniref:aminoacyl--tRNA ligase-related protein n=1 Tax=Paenibacillus sp. OK060 TaxID=1881034 RepID=UPI0008904AA8|nr:aminoacyl--tRNA ligase-related protein [Paenibacillus sp. OK060]SDM33421.1 tRNA synthetase class II core domain (G, H, P, S and T) [Paenibacillus sp. OK060]